MAGFLSFPPPPSFTPSLKKGVEDLFAGLDFDRRPLSPVNHPVSTMAAVPLEASPFEGASEYASSEFDDDGEDEMMVEYTFADMSEIGARRDEDDEDWQDNNCPDLEPDTAPPTPSLDGQKMALDEEDELEEIEEAAPAPRQAVPSEPVPLTDEARAWCLEQFGFDSNGDFDGYDLEEKTQPPSFEFSFDATLASAASGADLGYGPIAHSVAPPPVASSSKAKEFDSFSSWFAAAGTTESTGRDFAEDEWMRITAAFASRSPSLASSPIEEVLEMNGADIPSMFASAPSPDPSNGSIVAVRDPLGGLNDMLIPSSVSASLPSSSITTGMQLNTPTWAFEGLIGEGSPASSSLSEGPSNIPLPPTNAAPMAWAYGPAATAAPPSAFQLTAPSETSSGSGSLRSAFESATDSASVVSSIASTSTPSLDGARRSSSSTATLEHVVSDSRLAAIEAARIASLNKPAGRKSSHHGKKAPGERKSAPKTPALNKGKGKQVSTVTKAPKPRVALSDKEATLKCGDCGKGFSRPYNLKIHAATHGGSKKRTFPCPHPSVDELAADMALARSDGCPLEGCNKAFSRRHDLTRHLEAYHEPWLVALGCTAKEASEDDFDPSIAL